MNISNDQSSNCTGVFHYMAAHADASLFRNGKVLMQRDALGSTARTQGVELEERTLAVRDARALASEDRPTCEQHGFELLQRPLANAELDFTDHAQVVRTYYAECAEVVAQATGAQAFAFDHNVRSAGGKQEQRRIVGGQEVQEPAHVVHGDYTLRSAPDRLSQLARPPSGNDTLLGILPAGQSLVAPELEARALSAGGRYAIINVWRNIAPEPVATHPLALCNAQSVAPEDLVVFEIHYSDRVGENYFAKYSPRHEMFYFPAMTSAEALLIKQWDSAGPLARSNGAVGDGEDTTAPCTFSFHSAFNAPATPADAPDRWSIEVRCMVIYD